MDHSEFIQQNGTEQQHFITADDCGCGGPRMALQHGGQGHGGHGHGDHGHGDHGHGGHGHGGQWHGGQWHGGQWHGGHGHYPHGPYPYGPGPYPYGPGPFYGPGGYPYGPGSGLYPLIPGLLPFLRPPYPLALPVPLPGIPLPGQQLFVAVFINGGNAIPNLTQTFRINYRPGLTVYQALAETGVVQFSPFGTITSVSGVPIGSTIQYQILVNGRQIPANQLNTPVQSTDTISLQLFTM